MKGEIIMGLTQNEKELISLIRNHKNPTEAFEIAIELMAEFLKEERMSETSEAQC